MGRCVWHSLQKFCPVREACLPVKNPRPAEKPRPTAVFGAYLRRRKKGNEKAKNQNPDPAREANRKSKRPLRVRLRKIPRQKTDRCRACRHSPCRKSTQNMPVKAYPRHRPARSRFNRHPPAIPELLPQSLRRNLRHPHSSLRQASAPA